MTNETETSIRFKVRQQYREEGTLTVWRSYPLESVERSIALSESHKIFFDELHDDNHNEH